MIESEMGIYTHPVASPCIRDVGQRLIGNLDPALFDYSFQIVDIQQPNAFALPGGHIYISRGLLCLVNTEDELAGILGHEIMHSELRHSVKKMRRQILPALLQIPGAIVGNVVDENLGNLINTPLNASSQLFLASYSRTHEKQADKGGTRLMAISGYEPSDFPAVLNRLSILIREITGQEEEFTYFDSHPYTPKRVDYLNREILKLSPVSLAGNAPDREKFLRSLDGLCAGDNPDHGVFQGNHFLHPRLDLSIRFPEGWVTDNQPTMVGAIDTTDNQSMVVLGIAPGEEAPEALGVKFDMRLRKEFGVVPDRSEPIDLNGMPAYLVSLRDNTSGGEPVRIHSLWFRLNGVTYQTLGLARESQTENLRNTALSIRTLTKQERESINVHKLRIREALADESLKAFNARTGNLWSVQITAIMNNLDPDVTLAKGQMLKVAVKERYIF